MTVSIKLLKIQDHYWDISAIYFELIEENGVIKYD